MQLPRQITFRNLDRSEAIEANIRERVEKLKQFYGSITSCRVVVEAEHKRHQHGNHYHVRVDVTVPDGEVVANREPDERQVRLILCASCISSPQSPRDLGEMAYP